MKTWLGVAIYLHLVFGAAALFGLSVAAVMILCLLGIGAVALVVPAPKHSPGPKWLARIVRRMK